MSFLKSTFQFMLVAVFICGCSSPQVKNENATTLATMAGLSKREISAAPFVLTSFERVKEKGTVARIYIEGDGMAWLSRSRPSFDPTPGNPLALKLAVKDPHPNVIYLGRPCQYNRTENCRYEYWTSKRFSEEVIASFDIALNELKKRHDFSGFELIAFSGGAAVAVLVSARRDDIKNIRTVAGNLDHVVLNQIHEVSAMPHSLNPADVATKISHIPQLHLVGGKDTIVSWKIFDSYSKKAGSLSCLNMRVLPEASHGEGWAEKWPGLLKMPLICLKDCF